MSLTTEVVFTAHADLASFKEALGCVQSMVEGQLEGIMDAMAGLHRRDAYLSQCVSVLEVQVARLSEQLILLQAEVASGASAPER